MHRCPVCCEEFSSHDSFRHLVSFHGGRSFAETWHCGGCRYSGTFDEVAEHCFRAGHQSGEMSVTRPTDSQRFPALLQEIQTKLKELSGSKEVRS